MSITETQKREILVRARARKFANEVKESNMAILVPDDLIDWLHNDEIQPFFAHLRAFGLTQRNDCRWERA